MRICEASPICSSRPTASSISGRCSARAALGSSARSADAADARVAKLKCKKDRVVRRLKGCIIIYSSSSNNDDDSPSATDA